MTTNISARNPLQAHAAAGRGVSRAAVSGGGEARHTNCIRPARRPRRGLTLVELMIAMVISLIVLAVMMRAFNLASSDIAKGRSVMEMASQLRAVEELLRADLQGLTVFPRPASLFSAPNGYFEIIEGPWRADTAVNRNLGPQYEYLGDFDDILAMTTRARDLPFRGKRTVDGAALSIEAPMAEVIWWTDFEDRNGNGAPEFDENIRLFRRVLLIRPDIDLSFEPAGNAVQVRQFFARNDISARWVDTTGDGNRDRLVANSLSDLTRREYRFAHHYNPAQPPNPNPNAQSVHGYPHPLDRSLLGAFLKTDFILGDEVLSGDEVLLNDVSAFDVRVYAPDAPLVVRDNQTIQPGDPGFPADPSEWRPEGAFVDLGFMTDPYGTPDPPPVRTGPMFSHWPLVKSRLWYLHDPADPQRGYDMVYCTFSPHYESDGLDQDGTTVVDSGTNGLDDFDRLPPGRSLQGVVDDELERETSPPYANPVRALQVTLRVVDKPRGQVQQSTIVHNFVPQ